MTAPRTNYAALPTMRGFIVLYRPGETNLCPGCSGRHWLVGRMSAECPRCGTALPLISPAMPGIITEGHN